MRSTARRLALLAVTVGAGIAQAQQNLSAVVSGQVTMNRQGNLLSITNTPGSILNWQQFSIAQSETVRFVQQSAFSSVLNRVVGADPSLILGALQSNGRVFLINPNGIMFGAGAQIDVGGLVASTLNLSNADFLAGRLRFTDTPGAGGIVNQGTITTSAGGSVYLIAPDIQNPGVITSPQGEVILAAGRSVELVAPGTPNLRVEITAPDNQALNVGQIMADSGRIGIYAGLIRNTGVLRADNAIVGRDGEILLRATGSVTVAGTISAGSIQLNADGLTVVNGGSINGVNMNAEVTGAVVISANTVGAVVTASAANQVPHVMTFNTGSTLTLVTTNAVSGGSPGLSAPAGFLRAFLAAATPAVKSSVVTHGPTGQAVISGIATFAQQGNQLTISNSSGSIINWREFSIGANETTQFIQQSGSLSVQNRVTGSDPIILGVLQSNGNVTLVNPGGIVISSGGSVPVGGLTVSSGAQVTGPTFSGANLSTVGSIPVTGANSPGP